MGAGKILIVAGLAIAAAGVVWLLAERIGLGRLPGDIVVRRDRYTIYFPLMTSALISLLFSLILWLFSSRSR